MIGTDFIFVYPLASGQVPWETESGWRFSGRGCIEECRNALWAHGLEMRKVGLDRQGS